MPALGKLIRDLRKARGETLAAFGSLLGVRHNTVSQYETGKARPSAEVLLRLHELAKTGQQRAAIRAALGPVGAQIRTQEEIAHEAEGEKLLVLFDGVDEAGGKNTRERFQELCVEIARGGDVPLWMILLMELWVEMRNDPAARPRFEELLNTVARAGFTLKEASDVLAHQRPAVIQR